MTRIKCVSVIAPGREVSLSKFVLQLLSASKTKVVSQHLLGTAKKDRLEKKNKNQKISTKVEFSEQAKTSLRENIVLAKRTRSPVL